MKKYFFAVLFAAILFQFCHADAAQYTPEQVKYQKELKSNSVGFSIRPFHDAVIKGDYATVEKFLKGGINPNAQLMDTCALAQAILTENQDILILLLDNGANPDLTFAQWTPLNYAISKSNNEAAKILVEKGANMDIKSAGGYPLDVAVQKENAEIVKFLYERNAKYSPYVVYNALQSKNEEIKDIFEKDNKAEDLEFSKVKTEEKIKEERSKIRTQTGTPGTEVYMQ